MTLRISKILIYGLVVSGALFISSGITHAQTTGQTDSRTVQLQLIATLLEQIKVLQARLAEMRAGTSEQVNVNTSDPFLLPNDLVAAAPTECLPEVPGDVDEDKAYFYASQSDVALMQSLEVGERYGDFVYEGYICRQMRSDALNRELNAPDLYFSGETTFSGNDVYTEYAGIEHYRINDIDVLKLPSLITNKKHSSSRDYPNFKYLTGVESGAYNTLAPNPGFETSRLGTASKITVDGLVYGQVGGGSQSYYGGVIPNVIAINIE